MPEQQVYIFVWRYPNGFVVAPALRFLANARGYVYFGACETHIWRDIMLLAVAGRVPPLPRRQNAFVLSRSIKTLCSRSCLMAFFFLCGISVSNAAGPITRTHRASAALAPHLKLSSHRRYQPQNSQNILVRWRRNPPVPFAGGMSATQWIGCGYIYIYALAMGRRV